MVAMTSALIGEQNAVRAYMLTGQENFLQAIQVQAAAYKATLNRIRAEESTGTGHRAWTPSMP